MTDKFLTFAAFQQESPLPHWAWMQVALRDQLAQAVDIYLQKYTDERGWLIWRDKWDQGYQNRDGVDDFYEAFYNFPLVYLAGGDDKFLSLALHHWQAVTEQLTYFGVLRKDYDRGYDQFHQSEGYLFFYYLCMAAPDHPLLQQQAVRFAGFFLNEDPDAINYDPEQRILLAPHNGSEGARYGYFDQTPLYPYIEQMKPYGLPYHDVAGISEYDDLKAHENARRMGDVMQHRMGRGDVVSNLFVTSLITNAYLMTDDVARRERYQDWLTAYVRGWMERTRANNGIIPDNVGLDGIVGSGMDGRWYGGLYGWAWPHGWYNIRYAVAVSAINAFLMTRDTSYLEFATGQYTSAIERAEYVPFDPDHMPLHHHFVNHMQAVQPGDEVWLTPYRHSDDGWFDYHPLSPIVPLTLWSIEPGEQYRSILKTLADNSPYDWNQVLSFRTKEDSGHEEAWWQFINGSNPDYPELILQHAFQQVAHRIEKIQQDDADLTQVNIHHWQEHNPIITEPLIQQVFGVPQPIYYGGLLVAPVFYFDLDRNRCGLPADVAALIETRAANEFQVHLVNTSALHKRHLLLYSGSLRQHQFSSIVVMHPNGEESDTAKINSQTIRVELPANSALRLICRYDAYVNAPAYIEKRRSSDG